MWLVTGAGAVAAILWELAEYQSFVQNVESLGIYRDTVGDLCLGTSGALVAGLLVIALRRAAVTQLLLRNWLERSVPLRDIGGVQPGVAHGNENVVARRRRRRPLLEGDDVVATCPGVDDRTHV